SQIAIPSWVRQGTRIDDDSSSNSARIAGSSAGMIFSSKSRPANRANSQPRKDHDDKFLLVMVNVARVIGFSPVPAPRGLATPVSLAPQGTCHRPAHYAERSFGCLTETGTQARRFVTVGTTPFWRERTE